VLVLGQVTLARDAGSVRLPASEDAGAGLS